MCVKFSYDALCKLLMFAVTTQDSRFEEIVVPDQQLDDSKGKRRTMRKEISIDGNHFDCFYRTMLKYTF